MAVFDECIRLTADYVEKMRETGRRIREFSCADIASQLPFKVGPGAGSGLVMKSDTFLELGSPTTGSCAFALYSRDTSLIQDGRIRLIGPDVQESSAQMLPFGQVIMAGGENLTDEDYQQLIQSQYTGDQIEGYMVKSIPGHIWTRISKEVAQKGFSFTFLGMALMKIIKTRIPSAKVFEVLFVTSGKADIQGLNEIGTSVSAIAQAIKKSHWEKKGIDITDCAFGGDCGACSDKSVCDEVRKAVHRKKQGVQNVNSEL